VVDRNRHGLIYDEDVFIVYTRLVRKRIVPIGKAKGPPFWEFDDLRSVDGGMS
jgi:hypothetical protein